MLHWYRLVRPLLFRLDAERAHRLAFALLERVEQVLQRRRRAVRPWTHASLQQQIWGIDFANPIGLAAGFDKDARAVHVWSLLGFGFAELGTVTALAQPGNPSPRLFRLAGDRALINRLGFNNRGADAVAEHLRQALQSVAAAAPIGINLGKSKVTPLERAAEDYVHSLRRLWPLAAYVVVNVSSPNTPGLRDLQGEEHLAALMAALRDANAELARQASDKPRPLLIKVAPDLSTEGLDAVVRVAQQYGAAGLVATNTTIRRDGLHTHSDEAGGLSGAPLRARSTEVVRHLYRATGGALPIIGVGGIFDARDAYEKIRAGASLVQLYTGMIFEGPLIARHIARGLVDLLQRDGLANVRDAVGLDA